MLYEAQNERVEELNRGIYARNLSDAPLDPLFDIKPVSTKYALFPALDRRTRDGEPIHHPGSWTPQDAPVGGSGPLYGFFVDKETQLQNRFFALQKGGAEMQSAYIPASDSDLYKAPVFAKSEDKGPYPGLFKAYEAPVQQAIPKFITSMHLSSQPWDNATRTQLRVPSTQKPV
jgi:hypothetical protein